MTHGIVFPRALLSPVKVVLDHAGPFGFFRFSASGSSRMCLSRDLRLRLTTTRRAMASEAEIPITSATIEPNSSRKLTVRQFAFAVFGPSIVTFKAGSGLETSPDHPVNTTFPRGD